MMQLLDGWLRHKSEMVNFEAAKAICDMRDVTDGELINAVHVLQLFLTSPRYVYCYSVVDISDVRQCCYQICRPEDIVYHGIFQA